VGYKDHHVGIAVGLMAAVMNSELHCQRVISCQW